MTESIDPLATRVLAESFPLTAEVRAELVKVLYGVATSSDPKVRVREKAAAIRSILAISRANVDMAKAAASMVDYDAILTRLTAIEKKLEQRDEGGDQEDW